MARWHDYRLTMIPFFRKIRYKLAKDNQFLKYSRYAIGEIVLVVVGILIALQINNWNEDRKSKSILKSHLETLKSDIMSDIKNLEEIKNNSSFRYHSMQIILTTVGHKKNEIVYAKIPPFQGKAWGYTTIPNEIDSTFLRASFFAAPALINFDAASNGLDQLKNSGLLSFIHDDKIKKEIDNYYEVHERMLGEKEWQSLIYYKQYWVSTLTKNGFSPDGSIVISDMIKWLERDKEAVASLRNLVTNAEYTYYGSVLIMDKGQKLVKDIDAIIQKL